MAFTREMLQSMIDSGWLYSSGTVRELCRALLAEMDKQNVWDGAPENAVIAQVHFYKAAKTYATPSAIPMVYTRELPKSRAREIAEEATFSIENIEASTETHLSHFNRRDVQDLIEAAILKREKELEAGK